MDLFGSRIGLFTDTHRYLFKSEILASTPITDTSPMDKRPAGADADLATRRLLTHDGPRRHLPAFSARLPMRVREMRIPRGENQSDGDGGSGARFTSHAGRPNRHCAASTFTRMRLRRDGGRRCTGLPEAAPSLVRDQPCHRFGLVDF